MFFQENQISCIKKFYFTFRVFNFFLYRIIASFQLYRAELYTNEFSVITVRLSNLAGFSPGVCGSWPSFWT